MFLAQRKSCQLRLQGGLEQLRANVEWPADLECPMSFRADLDQVVTNRFVTALGSSKTRRVLGVTRVVGPSGALTSALNYEEPLIKSYRVRKKGRRVR